jgi:beta-lactam-binding protein with PASTA domain
VAVKNKANAPVFVAFDASEADNDCRFDFVPPAAEIAPGESVETTMRVRPPKQIWIGRPHERRLDVAVKTGEEAAVLQAAAAEEDGGDLDLDGGGIGGQIKGMGPRVYKPQVYKPNVYLGPGGLQVQKPMVRGPQVMGPQARGMNLNLNNLKMPGGQAPPAVTGPLLPTQAVFRQKPWLPWWVAIVVPLLALLALALFLLLPKNVTVPDVVGKKSAFEAEKGITEAGLRLAPKVDQAPNTKVPPGTIVGQTPKAGKNAKKDSEVSIQVAVGTGKLSVPDVVGKTAGEAEKALRKGGVTLGQATPQPVDLKAKIRSQIPAADEIVKSGAPVDIFLTVPAAAKGGKKNGGTAVVPAGGDGGDGGNGGGGAEPVVPPIAGAKEDTYAQKAGDVGLLPKVSKVFDDSPKGTIFKVVPEPGTKAKKGDVVTLFVSAGAPELAYDNDKDILLVNSANGKRLPAIAKSPKDEHDPAWSPDGAAVAFTSDGQVFLSNREERDAVPQALTKQGETFSDLAWAPTANVNALAMAKRVGNESDLCLGKIDAGGMTTSCKTEPGFSIERKINWAGDGKSILAFGFKNGSQFGIVRWRTTKPFSTNPEDYRAGRFVSDITRPGEGELDAAPSPDGKQLAIVNLGKNGRPELLLAKKNDFLLLSNPKPLGVIACKVIWRPDGRELVVVQSDDCIHSTTGTLQRLAIDSPKVEHSLGLGGDNPVFQPLTAG